MRSHRLIGLLAAIAVLAVSASRAESERSVSAEWEARGSAGERSLVLRFQGTAPAVNARLTTRGLDIAVEGSGIREPLPAEWTVEREGSTTTLSLARAGVVLRGVRLSSESVRIDLTLPEASLAGPDALTYTIGVGDVLAVSVYKNPDLSGEFPVDPAGNVRIPLVGPVNAAGKSEAEFADALTRTLASNYLVDPQVSVSVKTYQSQFVYVTGAVARSSRVAIRPGMTLRGVLAEAGVALSEGMTVELSRVGGESTVLESARLDTVSPRDGDVVTVQEPRYVAVYGEVRRPARVVLTPGMTLLQAIVMSEGLTEWASKKEVRIRRKSESGIVEILVDLREVETHQAPDPLLQAEDIIIVRRRLL